MDATRLARGASETVAQLAREPLPARAKARPIPSIAGGWQLKVLQIGGFRYFAPWFAKVAKINRTIWSLRDFNVAV
jgi:hypothetical protein